MQKLSFFQLFILQIQSILESCHMTSHTYFWPCQTLKFSNHLLLCRKLYQYEKTQLIPLIQSWDKVNIRVQRPDWPYPFLTKPNQKIFNQLLTFVNFYQLVKNEAVLSIYFGEIVQQKSWNLIGWDHFGLYLRSKIFTKYRIFIWTQQLIKIFIRDQIKKLWKLMTNFSLNSKIPIFGPFLKFLGQNNFQKNRAVMHNFTRVSGTMSKFREI